MEAVRCLARERHAAGQARAGRHSRATPSNVREPARTSSDRTKPQTRPSSGALAPARRSTSTWRWSVVCQPSTPCSP